MPPVAIAVAMVVVSVAMTVTQTVIANQQAKNAAKREQDVANYNAARNREQADAVEKAQKVRESYAREQLESDISSTTALYAGAGVKAVGWVIEQLFAQRAQAEREIADDKYMSLMQSKNLRDSAALELNNAEWFKTKTKAANQARNIQAGFSIGKSLLSGAGSAYGAYSGGGSASSIGYGSSEEYAPSRF